MINWEGGHAVFLQVEAKCHQRINLAMHIILGNV